MPTIIHAPCLASFAVYCPAWGPTEDTEERQIVFYHPVSASRDEMMRQIGLAQALTNFSKNFSPAKPCEIVHTKKHRIALFEPEPGFWLIMKVKLGYEERTGKDGKRSIIYLDSRPSEATLKVVSKKAYDMFRTFNPSFTDIERRESRESLKTRLDEFYIGYLDGLVFADVDMVKALNGISYLPFDQSSFLSIISFVNTIKLKFPRIQSAVILLRHYVVYSGLPDFADLSSFYDYIADPETGKYDDRIINQVKDKGEGVISTRPTSLQPIEKETPISVPSSNLSSSSSIFSSRKTTETNQKFSGFLIGPEDTGAEGGAKSFFLGRSREEYKVLVYQYLEDTTLAFFMPTFSDAASAGSIDSTDDSVDSTVNSTVDNDGTRFHSELRKHLEDRLQSLVGLLSDGYVKMRKAIDNLDQPYRYVYFNSINLAFKTSIGGSRAATVPDDLIIALTQMREEMDKYDLEELVFKTSGDLWIAGRKTEGREFHVILPKTDGNLVEVEEEMRKMASQSVFTE